MNSFKRKEFFVISLLTLMAVLAAGIVTGCTNSKVEKSVTEQQEPAGADSGGIKEFKEAVQYLKEGDAKSLIGIAFGDIYEKDKVELTGESHWLPQNGYLLETYKLKNDDKKGNFNLFFVTPYWENSKKEKSLVSVTCYEGDFFGITVGVDMFEKIHGVLGEPDMQLSDIDYDNQGNGTDERPYAVYNFAQASLRVEMDRDGKIQEISYRAQPVIKQDDVPDDLGNGVVSPNGTKYAYLWGFGWESLGTLTLYDAGLKEKHVWIMPDIPKQHTPSFLIWLDDRYLLSVVEYGYGTFTAGGEVYLYDTEKRISRKLIDAKDPHIQIMSLDIAGEKLVLHMAEWYAEGNTDMKDYNEKQSEISIQEIHRLIEEDGTYHLGT